MFKPDLETPQAEPSAPRRLDDREADRIIDSKIDFNRLERAFSDAIKVGNSFETLLYTSIGKPIYLPATLHAIARLVLELKDKLPEYDTLVSDDTSGRPITLLLRKLSTRSRIKKGAGEPKTFFIAAGRDVGKERKAKIKEFIEKNKTELGRTLLITEHIHTGGSITTLAKMLEGSEVNFDIASVSIIERPEADPKSYPRELTQRLYYGEAGRQGEAFYKMRGTGVAKGELGASAHPVKQEGSSGNPKHVPQLRKAIDVLAQEFSKLLE